MQPTGTSIRRLWRDQRFRLGVLVVALAIVGGSVYQTHADGLWSLGAIRAKINLAQAESQLRRDPQDLAALISAGVNSYQLRNYNEALRYYTQATEIDASSYLAWNNLGNVKRDLLDFWGAEAAYLKAIELEPGYIPAYINLSTAYFSWPIDEEGEQKQAQIVPLLQRGLDVSPDSEELKAAIQAYQIARQ